MTTPSAPRALFVPEPSTEPAPEQTPAQREALIVHFLDALAAAEGQAPEFEER